MRHALHSVPAESIIETIIAITVIVIGTAAALSMLRSSLDGNEFVGEKEIAINLALEGIDALKNIRDANYLRYSAYADDCWNTYDATAADCSDGTIFDAARTYYFTRIFSGTAALQWRVLPATSSSGYLSLYGVDIDADGIEDMGLYAQSGITTNGFFTQQTRVFRRYMTMEYNSTGDAYDATVTVTWLERSVIHSISLTRTIAHVY